MDFVKDEAKIGAAIAGITFCGFTGSANADGRLRFSNMAEPFSYSAYCFIKHSSDSGVSDGYDSQDLKAEFDLYFDNTIGSYSQIPGYNLCYDARPKDSNTSFNLKLFYKGTTGVRQNSLLVNFYPPEPPFDNKPIIFESDRLPYGSVVDIRKVIENGGGGDFATIPLIDLAAGTYTHLNPYGSAVVTIGTRLLADLNDDGIVDLPDYTDFAKDWGKGPGQYVADISGPNSIPDGYVNNYDLGAFGDGWLDDVNDPNTW